jgi:hypothetical protein
MVSGEWGRSEELADGVPFAIRYSPFASSSDGEI